MCGIPDTDRTNITTIMTLPYTDNSIKRHVLLVHGGPGATGSLHAMAERLSGMVCTTECKQTEYTVDGLKRELMRQIDRNEADSLTLIGHSWGAWLSVMVAAEHIAKVKRLILIGCPPFEEKYVPLITANRLRCLDGADRERFALILSGLDAHPDRQTVCELKRYTEITDNHCLINHEETDFDSRMYNAVWTEASAMRKRGELKRMLHEISCEVDIIYGDKDPHPLQGVLEPLDEAGINYRLHRLSQCGHSPFLEKETSPDFYQTIYEIINRQYIEGNK